MKYILCPAEKQAGKGDGARGGKQILFQFERFCFSLDSEKVILIINTSVAFPMCQTPF